MILISQLWQTGSCKMPQIFIRLSAEMLAGQKSRLMNMDISADSLLDRLDWSSVLLCFVNTPSGTRGTDHFPPSSSVLSCT